MNGDELRRIQGIRQPPLPGAVVDFLRDVDRGVLDLKRGEFVVSEEFWGTPDEARFVFLTAGRRLIFPFSERLNGELLRRGIRMATADQEALRSGAHVLSNLQYADSIFGRELTDSVLWEVVNLRFGGVTPIKKVLGEIVVITPPESEATNACAGYVEAVINGQGNSLVLELSYDNSRTAFAILAGAVLFILDRRHSLSLSHVRRK